MNTRTGSCQHRRANAAPAAVWLLAALLSVSSGASAQQAAGDSESTPQLYKVELVIFANEDSTAAGEDFSAPPAPITLHPDDLPSWEEAAPQTGGEAAPDGGVAAAPDRQNPDLAAPPTDEVPPAHRFSDGTLDTDIPATAQPELGYIELPSQFQRPPLPKVLEEVQLDPFLYRLIPADQMELNGVYERMHRLRPYRPLMHVGWIQPAFDEAHAHAMDLGAILGGSAEITGTATFYTGRFPHLDLAVEFRPNGLPAPAAPDSAYRDAGSSGLQFSQRNLYEINEERRIRYGELDYYDHPEFGVIAVVDEYTPPEPENPAGPESDAEPSQPAAPAIP